VSSVDVFFLTVLAGLAGKTVGLPILGLFALMVLLAARRSRT
jgi:hypothetical protein